jgi:subtilisin family serine protease
MVVFVAIAIMVPTRGVGEEAGSATVLQANTYASGEVLIKYKAGMRAVSFESQRQRLGLSSMRDFAGREVKRVRLPSGLAVPAALEILRQDPAVEYAEPNYYRFLARTPNDPRYASQWGLPKISAPAAWDLLTDCTATVVAVIDSGADYEHPDLAANIWTNFGDPAGDGIDDDGNGYIDDTLGWDFVFDDNKPIDEDGHGTHVAGTIAAFGNNGRGVCGVCWRARLMILRAFDSFGVGTVADTIAAMDYARANGARVVNASYASGEFSQAEYDAISDLNGAGILMIAAAGNEGADNDRNPSYPASYGLPNIIAVAATDENDNLASFSNYGRQSVHIAAPGTDILSTYPERVDVLDEGFESGTAGWTLDPPIGRVSPGFTGSWSLADSPSGSYDNNLDVSAVSPALDLSTSSSTTLNFYLKGQMAAGDGMFVETAEAIGGNHWTPLRVWLQDPSTGGWESFENGVSGKISQWQSAEVDLSALDGKSSAYFRFRFQSDADGTAAGYSLDEVVVSALATGQDNYDTLSGTSMATPHVSGLTALLWSQNSGFSAAQVKDRILDSADRLAGLAPKIFAAGRINAANSLANVPAPPSDFAAGDASTNQISLSWDDNYSHAVGVRIERSENGGAFVEIASVNPGTAVYQDTGVQAKQTYTYRARAFNSENTSTYSAEISATAAAPSSGGGGGGGCFVSILTGH